MARYALVESNEVINTIVYNGEDFYQPPQGELVVCTENVNIGWQYVNGEFINPSPED